VSVFSELGIATEVDIKICYELFLMLFCPQIVP